MAGEAAGAGEAGAAGGGNYRPVFLTKPQALTEGELHMSRSRTVAAAVVLLAAFVSLFAGPTPSSAQGLRDRLENRGDLRDLLSDRLQSRDDLRDLISDRMQGRADLRDLLSDRIQSRDDLRDLILDRIQSRDDGGVLNRIRDRVGG